jgi:hypothetical protein
MTTNHFVRSSSNVSIFKTISWSFVSLALVPEPIRFTAVYLTPIQLPAKNLKTLKLEEVKNGVKAFNTLESKL